MGLRQIITEVKQMHNNKTDENRDQGVNLMKKGQGKKKNRQTQKYKVGSKH